MPWHNETCLALGIYPTLRHIHGTAHCQPINSQNRANPKTRQVKTLLQESGGTHAHGKTVHSQFVHGYVRSVGASVTISRTTRRSCEMQITHLEAHAVTIKTGFAVLEAGYALGELWSWACSNQGNKGAESENDDSDEFHDVGIDGVLVTWRYFVLEQLVKLFKECYQA